MAVEELAQLAAEVEREPRPAESVPTTEKPEPQAVYAFDGWGLVPLEPAA